jgi:hypothetical protein
MNDRSTSDVAGSLLRPGAQALIRKWREQASSGSAVRASAFWSGVLSCADELEAGLAAAGSPPSPNLIPAKHDGVTPCPVTSFPTGTICAYCGRHESEHQKAGSPPSPPSADDRAELLRSLKWIKEFAEAHHAQQPSGVHLHSLTVDIPQYLDYAIAMLETGEASHPPSPETGT